MDRRSKQLFSLSLLDLLTSALGAVIFLFIITPKGGASASQVRQATVFFDTTQMKIYGDLPDSLLTKSAGDTLHTILIAYKDLPQPKPAPVRVREVKKPKAKPIESSKPKPTVNRKPTPTKVEKPTPQPKPTPTPPKKKPAPPVYKGDAPSVPARVSFEVTWANKEDNVDLFVCKGNNCVYGGRKKDSKIGQWDSGKSRNRIFGNDLRTNQEAVRQFDKIIPGEYKLYAQFKDSKKQNKAITIHGLIYTKDEKNQERGENFTRRLQLGKDRMHIATVILKADGTYTFKRP